MSILSRFVVFTAAVAAVYAEGPGDWKTWVIGSEKDHGVVAPPDENATRGELEWLRGVAVETDARIGEQVRFWNAGPPSYRRMEMLANRQNGGEPIGAFPRAHAYVSMAIYDATIAAAPAAVMAYLVPAEAATFQALTAVRGR